MNQPFRSDPMEAAHARLEAVLRQMPSGVILAEAPTGRLILHNDQVRAIWRVESHDADRIAEYGRYRGFRPDGRPYEPDEWPLARSLLHGETINYEEIDIIRFDETRGTIAVSSAPIRDRAGEIVAAVVVFEDITERREEERQRAFLAEAGRLLASSLDYYETLQTLARLAVPTVADWCAVDVLGDEGVQRLALVHPDPAREALAREITRRWPEDPAANTGVPNVLRSGRSELYPEITDVMLERGIGDPEHLAMMKSVGLRSAMIVPMVARGGTLGAITFAAGESGRQFSSEDLQFAEQLASLAATAVDNARLYREAHSAREEAERARSQAEAASRAKGDFLSSMSHEIRTPINAIIGYSDLLDLGIGGELSEQQRRHIERVRLSSQHLLSLVDSVLDLAKVEAGRLDVAREPHLLIGAIPPALALVAPQASLKGIQILEPTPDQARVSYVGDEDRVRQILVNLLSNAVKFTLRGGEIRITCGTAKKAEGPIAGTDEGLWAYVRVSDTGVGITPEEADVVFEPFEQALHSPAEGGTGLGLTISRQLARLMGGDLTLQSTPGAGSTFTLWLPAQQTVAPLMRETMRPEATRERRRGPVEVGTVLRDSLPELLDAFTSRLRSEISAANGLHRTETEDHTHPLLAAIAANLLAVGDAEIDAVNLVRDGGEIRNVISRLHGAQRARVGWTTEGLAREFAILREEVGNVVRRDAPANHDTEYALDLVIQSLRHAERESLQALRRAGSSSTRGLRRDG
jgi:signal transduction histidine kinase